MKKLLVLFLFALLMCYCSSGSDSEDVDPFTIQGTCYLDGEPISGIEIDFGIAKADQEKEITFDSTIRQSDSEGKFKFENKLLKGNYQYRIRAKSPITTVWTSYQQSAALIGQTVTRDFHFINK